MMRIKEVTRGELVEKYIVENVIANLKPGDKIPSERELASELGVAVHTVNKCLATLTERGVLCRRKGRGTFLAECSPRGKRVRILTRSMDYYERNAVTNWFNFQYVLEGFSIRAQELGMIPEIFLLNDLVPPTEETMEKLLEPDVSGYLFHIHRNQEVIRQWTTQLQENGKIVLCRSYAPFDSCNTVYADMRSGVRNAIRYLLDSGRRRIALFEAGWEHDGYISARINGYRDAHENAGIVPDPALFRICDQLDEKEGYLEMRKLLEEKTAFDAVFAGTDTRAYGIMRALKEAGIRIPEDVAIVGTDNLREDLNSVPTLSSVDYPMHSIGTALCDIFAEIVTKRSMEPVCRMLPCEFIRRESC